MVVGTLLGLAQPALAARCPSVPEPVIGLSFESRYKGSDPSRAELNDATEQEAESALEPVDAFLRDLAALSDDMLQAKGRTRLRLANCVMGHLADWARADALSQQDTQTARLTIGARLAGFAIIAGRASTETTDYAALDAVRLWLTRRMREQMQFWEDAPPGASAGNLRAWAGLAGAATAALTEDKVMRGWAAWSVSYVLCSAAPDGSLPQEMTRGARALHYQLYALAPLVTSVLLLERQGVQMMEECDRALPRAVKFALSDLNSGAKTQAITGEVQTFFDGRDKIEDHHLAWIEAYLLLFPDIQIEALAKQQRPLSFSKLGGNQELLWRR